jgi:hypothetical protein
MYVPKTIPKLDKNFVILLLSHFILLFESPQLDLLVKIYANFQKQKHTF